MKTDNYVVAWRAWYDLGNGPVEYTSEETTLDALPDDGFQAMRLWYADGTGRFISGSDYYFFLERPDGIIFGQTNEEMAKILERYPGALIKRGRYAPDGIINQISAQMVESEMPKR